MHVCSGSANEELRGIESCRRDCGTQPSTAGERGTRQSGEFGPNPLVREQTGWPGAECLRFAAAGQVPPTGRQAQPPPAGLQPLQIGMARLRSPLLGAFPQGKKKKL